MNRRFTLETLILCLCFGFVVSCQTSQTSQTNQKEYNGNGSESEAGWEEE
jgi:hypothetical protein